MTSLFKQWLVLVMSSIVDLGRVPTTVNLEARLMSAVYIGIITRSQLNKLLEEGDIFSMKIREVHGRSSSLER